MKKVLAVILAMLVLVLADQSAVADGIPAVQGTLFPPTAIWYRDISALPVADNSQHALDLMQSLVTNTVKLENVFGGDYNGQHNGFQVTYSASTDPVHTVVIGQYPQYSDWVTTNLANGWATQNDPDNHLLNLVNGTKLFEAWHYRSGSSNDTADQTTYWNTTSLDMRPGGWPSADAAGLPILPLLVPAPATFGAAPVISHALRLVVTVQGLKSSTYEWPASHTDGGAADPLAAQMGNSLRLKASYDISGYPPQAKAILQALKTYGGIIADTDHSVESMDNVGVCGIWSPNWDMNNDLPEIRNVPLSAFDLIDLSPYQAAENSYAATAP
jgi:hypothetical protein